jgi:hypothetical protein
VGCLVSDFHPEVHALLDDIVHPTPGYGRHCKLLVSEFRCSGMVERLREERKDYGWDSDLVS